ncbi:MAG: trehalose-phosphatase [Chloroflexota bacterium]
MPGPRDPARIHVMAAGFFADPAHAGLFLDFDGTLAPIVADPALARLGPRARGALHGLTPRYAVVAVLSGRSLDDLSGRVDVPGLWLSGGHGRAIRAPNGSTRVAQIGPDAPDRLARAEAAVGQLSPAIRIERKPASIAFHYRGQEGDAALVAELTARVRAAAEPLGLVAAPGRCLVELRLPGVDKGVALRTIVAETGVGAIGVAGDDWTDLDAFRAARSLPGCLALTVAARGAETPPALLAEADLILEGVDGVVEWLERLL